MSSVAKNKLLSLSNLTPDQNEAIDRLYEHDQTFMVAGMGSGKTVIALTALDELLDEGVISRALIIAPVKVCNAVWAHEHTLWEHLNGLTVDVCTGSEPERLKKLGQGGKIVVTNFENVKWLTEQPIFKTFDALLIDEATKIKAGGQAFKALRKHIPNFKWRTAMTGTPVSENFQQLFYQVFVVDNGRAFGKNKEKFMLNYFYPTDFNGYKWTLKPEGESQIMDRLKPCLHVVPDYQDTLPPLSIKTTPLPLPPDAWKIYEAMAKSMQAEGVTADSAAVQTMKLQQIANGFLYRDGDADDVVNIHNEKFGEIKSSVEKMGKTGRQGILIIYQFKEELDRLNQIFPAAPVIGGGGRPANVRRIVSDWNKGCLNVLLLHPKAGGHGLNLAKGGCHVIWISPPWSRDLFDQTNARLWRRGQERPVEVRVLVAADTVDQLILARLDNKAAFMAAFKRHIAAFNG